MSRFIRVNRLYHHRGRDGDFGVGKSKFHKDIVERPGAGPNIPGTDVPRLKLTKMGEKVTLAVEEERDRVIKGLQRWHEAQQARAASAAPRPRDSSRTDELTTP